MDRVGYLSPLVPPEWIAAHGLRPVWLAPGRQAAGIRRGACPCAESLIATALARDGPDLVLLTTACDQMRYAAALIEADGRIPTFLLNLPSTWQTPQTRRLYRDELERLGRFCIAHGGCQPSPEQIVSTLGRYDDRRQAAMAIRPRVSAGRWAEMLVDLRSDMAGSVAADETSDSPAAVPLALVGGPLPSESHLFLDLVTRAGGRIVLDASEAGERTLPAAFDHGRLRADPLDELVRAYFDTIPDIFRRPNTRLYEWLDARLAASAVRGIIFRRYLFCDLWHAELHPLRQRAGLPVLDLDVAADEESQSSRTQGRIEAFLEMLR